MREFGAQSFLLMASRPGRPGTIQELQRARLPLMFASFATSQLALLLLTTGSSRLPLPETKHIPTTVLLDLATSVTVNQSKQTPFLYKLHGSRYSD